MQADPFEEAEFYRAIVNSGARVLLIGRRALIALGLPMVTSDYDLWAHIDDVEVLNRAVVHLDLYANVTPQEARARGRYVLENGEHVDVLTAHSRSSPEGERLSFDEAWERRQEVRRPDGVRVLLPSIDDLIRTKRWAQRDKDMVDIRALEGLKAQRQS